MHKQDDLMVHIIQRVTNQDNTNEPQLFPLQKGGENIKSKPFPQTVNNIATSSQMNLNKTKQKHIFNIFDYSSSSP